MDFSKVRDFEYSYYSLADVVPWSALIAPGIVINKDESLMQVFSYAGLDQDSATREELMTMAAKANNYVKRFGEGWCLWFEARRVKANVYKHREFPDVACQLLDFACECYKRGGVIPSVLNGANEEAVAAFLQEKIKFPAISEAVMKVTSEFANKNEPTLEDIISAGFEARARVRELLK